MTAPRRPLNTIDEYIRTFPPDVQKILEQLRETIHESAPEAEETIRYGIPTFTLNGNLVHFAAFENHIGFYPAPSAIEAFRKELSLYHHAKGSVRFPINEPIPFGEKDCSIQSEGRRGKKEISHIHSRFFSSEYYKSNRKSRVLFLDSSITLLS